MNKGILNLMHNNSILQFPFYITQISIDFNQYCVINRDNGFEDYQIAICVGGSGIFECNGEVYEINEHDAFLFAPHIPHKYYPTGDAHWILDWLCYNGHPIESLYTKGYCVISGIKTHRAIEGIKQLYMLLCENSIANMLEASKQLYGLLIELVACNNGVYNNKTVMIKLEPIISYMEKNFAQDISLDGLSSKMGVSVSYFCRAFKSVYQLSPMQYLNSLRINHAKCLIQTTPKTSVKEIAEKCGYKDTSYFCAQFKKSVGITPTAYRNLFW